MRYRIMNELRIRYSYKMDEKREKSEENITLNYHSCAWWKEKLDDAHV